MAPPKKPNPPKKPDPRVKPMATAPLKGGMKVDKTKVKPMTPAPLKGGMKVKPPKKVKPKAATPKPEKKAPVVAGSQMDIFSLMKNTFPNRFESANATAVLAVRLTPARPNDTTIIMKTKGTTGDPASYITKVERPNSKVKYSKSKLKVFCGCPDFKYTWAWALSQKGAAIVDASNEDAPDVRNPGYKPGVCKHLLAALQRINETKI